jgi:hypothetical protein
MNKRQAAETLRVSERTLTDWQQRGCPYTPGGPGRDGEYDPIAIARWAGQNGLGEPQANSPGAASPDLAADHDAHFMAEMTGRILGKLLSDAAAPACVGLMDESKLDAAGALRAYGVVVSVLVAVNDRIVRRDCNYHIDGMLVLAGANPTAARAELDRRYDALCAARVSTPAAVPPASSAE